MIWIYGICLVLLIWSTVTDLRTHEIRNSITYTGTILALTVRFLNGGWLMLEDGLKGFGICLFIMLVCYVLYNIGGGDLKLMSMTGAFLGVEEGITLLLWTLTLGAIAAVIILIWKIGTLKIITGIVRHFWLVLKTCRWIPLNTSERQPLQAPLYLGPAALIAYLLTCGHSMYELLKPIITS